MTGMVPESACRHTLRLADSARPRGLRRAGRRPDGRAGDPRLRARPRARRATSEVTLAAPGAERARTTSVRAARGRARRLRRADRRRPRARRRRRPAAAAAAARARSGASRRGSSVDLYNPTVVEAIEATRGKPAASRARLNRIVGRAAAAHLAAADFALCASERQRDLWLGVLAGPRGCSSPTRSTASRSCRSASAPSRRGAPTAPVMRGAARCPRTRGCCCGAAGSGTGSTRRPRSAPSRACPTTSTSSSRASGARRCSSATSTPPARAAIALARELGLEGTRVHFNHDWVPYERARRVAARGRPRRLRPPRPPRDPLRLPHPHRRLPVGRAAGRHERGRRARRPRRGRAASAARSRPGDDAAFAAGVRRAARRSRARPRRGRARRRTSCAGTASSQPLLDFCRSGAKRAHDRHRARAIRSATIGQYAPIAMETLDAPTAPPRSRASSPRTHGAR